MFRKFFARLPQLVVDRQHSSWVRSATIEVLAFFRKQVCSALFPAFIFLALWASPFITPPFLHRYDVLLILCLALQVVMYGMGVETKDELLAICFFHLLGLGMELFKVHAGSWSYPEDGLSKIAGVPLYSGFMYASVASYIMQVWRRFKVQITHWPPTGWTVALTLAIYGNFFANAWWPDARWFLMPGIIMLFFFTRIHYTVGTIKRTLPLLVAFLLLGLLVWLAENISTLLGAWKYPYQHEGWKMVGWNKLSSWLLMAIVSVVIVAEMKLLKARPAIQKGVYLVSGLTRKTL